jgi:hypothetical protein
MRLEPQTAAAPAAVSLRRWPYPYRAALAICSDLDETPDAGEYFEMVRFLNTGQQTRLGAGVNLEVGNTIYFDMPPSQFSYWNGDDGARARVRALIQSGHVDCLHSFGDLATTRAQAGRALDDLARHGCGVKVWIDHAVAPSNFGGDIMRGFGDVEGSAVYHADLTLAFGIEYVWRGRVTSVIGQDTTRRLSGIVSLKHPFASGMTVAKEAAKGWLARRGSAKYAPHESNVVLWDARLRSGQPVLEFLRANPSWAGISVHETADGLGEVLGEQMLARLAERGAGCVLYTHLGKIRGLDRTLNDRTRRALHGLAERSQSGEILVTTTRRLLDYCRIRRHVAWSVDDQHGAAVVRVTAPPAFGGLWPAASELDGLSFYVDYPARARIVVNDTPVTCLQRNAPDETGRGSVSIPWRRLSLPPI